MKKPKLKASPKRGCQFVAATGAPFSNKQAAIIGAELQRIAEENRVDDIRSLDKHLVFEAVERDPRHPLRQFYNWNESEAARAHWIERTGLLIRSVRIVTVNLGKMSKPMPMFLYDPNHMKRSPTERTRRGHVLTEDAMLNDPVFASAVSAQIRALELTLDRLEQTTSMRSSPVGVAELRDEVRVAMNRYFERLATAAE